MPNQDITVAVIASGIDEEYQHSILSGIHRYAAHHRVHVAHFIAYGGMLANPKYDQGEYNIFTLPNFSQFDGVILLSNTFSSDLAADLSRRIAEAGIPAVSIDRDLEGMFHVGIRNGDAMEQITRHFIEEHGVRRFNFISGPDDNTESMERLSSFRKVLAEYNIPLEDERIYRGSFRAKDGRRAIEAFMRSELPMPDAIVCANDAMAISAMLTLEEHGIHCPEDILVSGFDNIYNAKNFSPALTTVERPLMQSGALACEMICRVLDGEPSERVQELNAVPIYSESCGCTLGAGGEDISLFKKRNYQVIEGINSDISLLNQMSCALVECDTFEEYIAALQRLILKTGCEEFYLCLNDNWHTKRLRHDTFITGEIPEDSYTVHGYSGRMIVPLAYYDGTFSVGESFNTDIMLPRLRVESAAPRKLYFVPLHFRERCLGYFVIVNSDMPMGSSLFHTWSINISNSMENFRKLLCLDEVVQELDKLYAVDSLTGVFNRNGFNRETREPFRRCIEEQRSAMIMFVDMDGLKQINDNYGHKSGDHAIRSIASVLQETCYNGELTCRFGGDEFFIFAADYTEEDVLALRARMQEQIDICNRNSGHPYTLSISVGAYITVPVEGTTLFQLITVADNRMYEEKKKKNPSKYLKQMTPDVR